jgi:hypothetical protein
MIFAWNWLHAGASLEVVFVYLFGRFALALTGLLFVYQLGIGLLKDKGIIVSYTLDSKAPYPKLRTRVGNILISRSCCC